MKRFLLILVIGVLLKGFSGAKESQPLPTFIFAGQSNMVGKRCKVENLPQDLQMENPNALFFDAKNEKWIPIAPGKTEISGFGPEIAFAVEMSEDLNQTIGIIKHSRGGTNLYTQWNPENPNSLYAELNRKVEAARKLRSIQVIGMIWVQGGADSKSEMMSKAYSENLKQLIQRSRKDFQNPDMPFLSGRIPAKSSKTKPHWRIVRSAQQDLQLQGYQWVNCDDISTGSDNIHYDEAGMVKLGERQAKMMLEALKSSDVLKQ